MQLDGYKEQQKRGLPGFPIELYKLDQWHPRFHMGYHWHTECEIIHIDSGLFYYELDGVQGTARPGDVLFVNCGVLHAGQPADENARYRCLVFDPAMLLKKGMPGGGALREIAEATRLVQSHLAAGDEAPLALCRALLDAMEQEGDAAQMRVTGLLYQLFAELLAGGKTTPRAADSGNRKRIRQLKKVLALIDNAYATHLTLDQLADAAGMSPKYFCQFFQAMTHHSPIDYVNQHRVEVACVLLGMPEYSVTDVAFEVGFNDTSYFIRTFKKHKGLTPGQYARQAAGRALRPSA